MILKDVVVVVVVVGIRRGAAVELTAPMEC
jgi:hypothetical protein